MAIPKFTLTGSVFDLYDSNADGALDSVALQGATVTLTPNLTGQLVPIDGNLFRIGPITATVDSTTGKINGNLGVELLANASSLNLATPLQWQLRVNVTSTTMRQPKAFWFTAPSSGASVTVGSVSPTPGVYATGWNQGPAGATGPAGAVGATGPAGAAGPTGPAGAAGSSVTNNNDGTATG